MRWIQALGLYIRIWTKLYAFIHHVNYLFSFNSLPACQSSLNWWITQNLSKQFLNMLVESALTIMLGTLLHTAIIPALLTILFKCIADIWYQYWLQKYRRYRYQYQYQYGTGKVLTLISIFWYRYCNHVLSIKMYAITLIYKTEQCE